MEELAQLDAPERRDIFQEVATSRRLDFTIIEKDFWVCWTLRSLFSLPPGHSPMVFKGGTSLSKAYGLIQRFSEDIDIVTDVNYYLQRGLGDPETASSRTKQVAFMKALDVRCGEYVSGPLLEELRRVFAKRLPSLTGWNLDVDPEDPLAHTLLFQYPTSRQTAESSYIRSRVKIEFGWRSSVAPAETRSVTPYVAESLPNLFTQPDVACTTLAPVRTFWEKVTAIHATNQRMELPPFYSRHYADVAAMFQTGTGKDASHDLAMLDDVRTFKERYYRSSKARYDLAGARFNLRGNSEPQAPGKEKTAV